MDLIRPRSAIRFIGWYAQVVMDAVTKAFDGRRIQTLKRVVRRPEQCLEIHIVIREIQESGIFLASQPPESARRGYLNERLSDDIQDH